MTAVRGTIAGMTNTDEALARLVDVLSPLMDREFCKPFMSAWELDPFSEPDGETLHEDLRRAVDDAKRALAQ